MHSHWGEDKMLEKKIEASISKNNLDFIYDGAILGFSGGAAFVFSKQSRKKSCLRSY